MLNLSSVVAVEKNKLNTDSLFLVLLEINIPDTDTIRIVNNNEDIAWNSYTWQMFPFSIDERSETSNAEISQFQIKVANINNVIGEYVRKYETYVKTNGFTPITCTLYVVNTKDLDNTTPVFSTNLILSSTSINFAEVSFKVSARDLFRARTPLYRMYPNNCRFKFKSTQCGYSGVASSCDKSLSNCRTLSNSSRYGGFPTIGNGSVNV
ncbi:hypothetical protein [Arcobacter arenosus]|uniref:Phage minor tail protein L n=1 Tax=Arcobacter arenosus TaxID=2576037 RepID=A0A5R8Y5U2_9BACT|nr:hypothetical protein [Arcobacter arenosus]TLP41033.1 hypothetical protein FDK22_03165 [Arcobacter arenosus]